MRIIGIDPALTKIGWGVIDVNGNSIKFVACGTIKTDAEEVMSKRLEKIFNELRLVIDKYSPAIASIEEVFINNNAVSSLKLGHARGAIMLTLEIAKVKIFEYSTTAIKKAVVGVGRAEKQQVERMIKILLPQSLAKNNDESDALAAAICHVNNHQLY